MNILFLIQAYNINAVMKVTPGPNIIQDSFITKEQQPVEEIIMSASVSKPSAMATPAKKRKAIPWGIIIFALAVIIHITGIIILTRFHMQSATILCALAPIIASAVFGIRWSAAVWLLFTIAVNPILLINSYLGIAMCFSPGYLVGSLMTLVVVIVIGRLHDLERRVRQLNDKLYILSRTDDLTQLFNRRAVIELATLEIKRAERERGNLEFFNSAPSEKKSFREAEALFKEGHSINEYFGVLAFAIIDLDFFKNVNDSYGHIAGDKVLADFALSMKDSFRDTDIVGRYGGEEFLVIFPGTTATNAAIALKHLADRLRINKITLPENVQVLLTFSAGLAEPKEASETLDSLLERADAALYTAKKEGRDRIIIA